MAPQFGPHRWSAGYHDTGDNDRFRDARFTVADLSGSRFLDCDLSNVKIIDSFLVDMDLSGYVQNLVVNGVDVTGFVNAELDRRHPERVQLRSMRTADDFRAMGDTIETLWTATVDRARRLPEPLLHERVDGEWSFTETLRHLIFIVDSWAGRTILDEESPFHPLGLPQTAYDPADAAKLGMDVAAEPSFAEVMAAVSGRMNTLGGILAGLTDDELGRVCHRSPAPGYPEEDRPVAECLAVVFNEECEHHRFATRDLAILEART
jgi:hypothetical protein